MFSAGRVLLMPKGAYNPLTTYEMLDIVSYNGSSYIAKGTTTGNLPTDGTYWQLSAYGGQAANIAGNFAELESSSVATATHYVDDIFVDENSQLMKATQTINIGDTIDANVNCAPTTVEALIAYLSSYVDSLDSLNKKIQGAIEIAAQTDLHSLAIGEYYKKQSTFYITNGPTGIDQDPTAIFRLTVEAALDNASQASSPLLLTLRTPDGKIYTQGFDGTSWGSWEQIAVESSVADVDTRVDSVESSVADVETSSTASKSYAVGESFYYNDVLLKATSPIPQGGTITPGTNCTPEKIIEKIDDLVSENQTLTNKVAEESAISDVLGAKNIFPNKLVSGTSYGVAFVNNGDGTITANGTFSEVKPTLLSNGWSDTDLSWITPFIGKKIRVKCGVVGIDFAIRFYDSSNTEISTIESGYNGTWGEDTVPSGIHHYAAYMYPSGTITLTDALIFPRVDYEPYAMTNREMTPYVQAISNPNLLDNPWFTVNQRGQSSFPSVNYAFWMDRWKLLGKNSETIGRTITLDDGINVSADTGSVAGDIVFQVIEKERFQFEKVYTLSVMLDDGKVYSVSGILPTPDGTYKIPFYTNVSGKIQIRITEETNKNIGVIATAVKDNVPFKIKAMKLELGSVSTLAQDTAPNYQQELAKCQRYFVRLEHASLGMGFTQIANSVSASIPIPVPMRTIPTISVSGDIGLVATDGTVYHPFTGATSWGENPISVVGCDLTGVTIPANIIGRLYSVASAYIDFSADL